MQPAGVRFSRVFPINPASAKRDYLALSQILNGYYVITETGDIREVEFAANGKTSISNAGNIIVHDIN